MYVKYVIKFIVEVKIMLILSKDDIKKVFTMKDAVDSVKEAFSVYSEGKSVVPLRVNIDVPKQGGQSLFMPGYVEDLDSIGIKIVSVFPKNAEKGKPVVPAQMLLLDGTTGEVCCIMEGTYLTQLRTGAASGAASDVLAIKDAKVAALFGAGGQAICQLEALLAVRKLQKIKVYSRDSHKLADFVKKANLELKNYGVEIVSAKSAEEAVKDADIITAVTTATKPVFSGNLVKKGAHINGVGSYTRDMQELDEYIVKNADKVFVDSKEAVLAESGDFIKPMEKGLIDERRINGELGEVIFGRVKGRENDDEITLFKTVGVAVQDVVTAYKIYKKALEKGIGKIVKM
jgi:ornithine cyclodeaminase